MYYIGLYTIRKAEGSRFTPVTMLDLGIYVPGSTTVALSAKAKQAAQGRATEYIRAIYADEIFDTEPLGFTLEPDASRPVDVEPAWSWTDEVKLWVLRKESKRSFRETD